MWRVLQRLARGRAPLPWDVGEGARRLGPLNPMHTALINLRAHYREGRQGEGSPPSADGRVMSHWKYSTLG